MREKINNKIIGYLRILLFLQTPNQKKQENKTGFRCIELYSTFPGNKTKLVESSKGLKLRFMT